MTLNIGIVLRRKRHLAYLITPTQYGYDYEGVSLMTFVTTYWDILSNNIDIQPNIYMSNYELYLQYLDERLIVNQWDIFGDTMDILKDLNNMGGN